MLHECLVTVECVVGYRQTLKNCLPKQPGCSEETVSWVTSQSPVMALTCVTVSKDEGATPGMDLQGLYCFVLM